ncbi:hypothetical protein GWK47_024536 [Chionoecetes opilio]|uniref:Uncharacterized protein n=1 Tax=Chionoecetes opilio TaxID=41210 RepID=A0A8J5CJ74_CHIOP|nr:hypothetical protein GWK47_024536 [Chionoecetes opilio]
MIEATNHQLGDIMAWRRRWQVKSTADKNQAIVMSRSREDTRLLEGKLKFGDYTLAIKDSINILGVEVDFRLSFDRHLETVARRASLRVTLLRRVSHWCRGRRSIHCWPSVVMLNTPLHLVQQ